MCSLIKELILDKDKHFIFEVSHGMEDLQMIVEYYDDDKYHQIITRLYKEEIDKLINVLSEWKLELLDR